MTTNYKYIVFGHWLFTIVVVYFITNLAIAHTANALQGLSELDTFGGYIRRTWIKTIEPQEPVNKFDMGTVANFLSVFGRNPLTWGLPTVGDETDRNFLSKLPKVDLVGPSFDIWLNDKDDIISLPCHKGYLSKYYEANAAKFALRKRY